METNNNANVSSSNPISLMGLALVLVILNSIIFINEFYLSFRQVFMHFLKIVFYLWGDCSDAKKHCIDRNVTPKLPMEKPEAASIKEAHCNKDLKCEELSIGEVKMAIEQLGICYDPDNDKLQERMSSNEIAAIFQEQEPSLEEVKEAFCIFDANNDGIIDANELKKVISSLCLTEPTESECTTMIGAYDDNGDGVIDFDEFSRLLTKSLI